MGRVEFTPLKVISSGRMKRARLVTMYEKPDHCSAMLHLPRFGAAAMCAARSPCLSMYASTAG